jgi:hypothetical protein
MFPLSAALVAVSCAIGMSTAGAEEITRQNATGICQGALPAFDTQIRKRPLAIRNEGTQSSFVSCSLAGTGLEEHNSVEIVFTNSSPVSVDVNCTVVSGRATFGAPPLFYPRVVTLAAGSSNSIVHEFDNAVDPANLINSSCILPAGVSLDYIRHDSNDPV